MVKSVPKATLEKNTNVIFAVYSANSNQEQIYDNVNQQPNSSPPGFIDLNSLLPHNQIENEKKSTLELSNIRNITDLTLTTFLQNNISISKKNLLLRRIKNKSDLIMDLNFLVQLPLPFCGKKGLCNWPKNVLIHGKPVCE